MLSEDLIPVVTIVASMLVLREPFSLVAGIGMALILGGMALSERKVPWGGAALHPPAGV